MTITTSEQFKKNLLDSGLMTQTAIARFLNSLPTEQIPDSAEDLMQLLLRGGKLTEYQAAAVFQGSAENLVIGDYEIQDQLGEGGMGVVYKAKHRRMKRVVAFKVLRFETMKSPGAVDRFYQEVQAVAQLSHPNIVTAHDAGEVDDVHYLAMELVHGKDLDSVINNNGRLTAR